MPEAVDETVDQQMQKLAQRGDTAAAYTIAFIKRLQMVYGDKWEQIYKTLYAGGGKDESYQASDDETMQPVLVTSRNTKFPGFAPIARTYQQYLSPVPNGDQT